MIHPRPLALLVAAVLLVALGGCEANTATVASEMSASRFALMIHPAAATARTDGTPAPWFDGEEWTLGSTAGPLRYPIQLTAGMAVDEWIVFFRVDRADDLTLPRVVLQRLETVSHLTVDIGPDGAPMPQGSNSLAIGTKLSAAATVTDDDAYSILVVGGGSPGVHAGAAAVYGARE